LKPTVDAAAVALEPAVPQSAHRLALVAFEPQEKSYSGTPRDIQGGMSGTAPAPSPAQVRPPAGLEEQFASGWDNWVGGVEDWQLGAAGARTGSLALLVTSLEMRDCELEFLARLENRSVNWVLRAADLENYLQCAIVALPGGGFQLEHWMVRGGQPEGAIVTPLKLALRPRPTLNVRACAIGDEFTVYVDSEPVARWNDGRLPAGGAGFLGTGEDRARLYWVRLSSPGAPARSK
jgi:hypothetical protein